MRLLKIYSALNVKFYLFVLDNIPLITVIIGDLGRCRCNRSRHRWGTGVGVGDLVGVEVAEIFAVVVV